MELDSLLLLILLPVDDAALFFCLSVIYRSLTHTFLKRNLQIPALILHIGSLTHH